LLSNEELDRKVTYHHVEECLKNPLDVYKLDLSEEELTELPKEVTLFKNLQHISLFGNKIKTLPADFVNLKNITKFDFSENPGFSTQVYNVLSKLPNLEELDLDINELSELHHEIGLMTNLKVLDLSDNQLTELPAEFTKLQKLEKLELNENKKLDLGYVFKTLSHLSSLKVLDLSLNKISALPNEIHKIESLKELDISYNLLTTLPKDFSKMKNLEKLLLRDNNFSTFPVDLVKPISTLKFIDLSGNYLSATEQDKIRKALPPSVKINF
jgi:Leucine-rich repeat (LRR) protein